MSKIFETFKLKQKLKRTVLDATSKLYRQKAIMYVILFGKLLLVSSKVVDGFWLQPYSVYSAIVTATDSMTESQWSPLI